MLTLAPSTGWPSWVSGRMRNQRDSFSAAAPKPNPDGVSPATTQPCTWPAAETVQFRVAEPVRPRVIARAAAIRPP